MVSAPLLTSWLLTYLVHSTVLVLGAWLLTRSERIRPATADVCWKAALLAGIVTSSCAVGVAPAGEGIFLFSAERGLEAAPDSAQEWAHAVRVRARVVDPTPACRELLGERGGLGGPPLSGGIDGMGEWVDRVSASCVRSLAGGGGWRWPPRWHAVLLWLWAVGAVLGMSRLASAERSARELRRRLVPPSVRARGLLEQVARGRHARRLRLAGATTVDSPCVLPGGAIVLPHRCEEELTDDELRAVLAHEFAHVARRDVLWQVVLRSVGALLWLQPLNRLALAEAEHAAELACDDWASQSTTGARSLARSLSRVAEWAAPPGRLQPGIAMARRGRRGLSTRVRRLLTPRAHAEPRWVRPAAAALLIAPMYWVPAVPPPEGAATSVIVQAERLEGLSWSGSAAEVGDSSGDASTLVPIEGRATGARSIEWAAEPGTARAVVRVRRSGS